MREAGALNGAFAVRGAKRGGGCALTACAQIYLNPDNDAIWEEKENAHTAETLEALATARSLLSQVGPKALS